MRKIVALSLFVFFIFLIPAFAQDTQANLPSSNPYAIFDDQNLLDGYVQKYNDLSKEVLLEIIQDSTLSPFQVAAGVRVFKNRFSDSIVSKEKDLTETILLRKLNQSTSPFIQIEIMHTLCKIDRYKYFNSLVPLLVEKLNHYNDVVDNIAYMAVDDLIKTGNDRPREARIIFNALRKILFLTRKKLDSVKDPDEKLKQKLSLVRWSIKVLGIQELNKLPKEVLDLL